MQNKLTFGFTEDDYQSFLSGNDSIDERNLTIFNEIDFDNALIRFEDIVCESIFESVIKYVIENR